ncbi:hypothetical protein AgCh_008386 [Apium graveolens]
MILAVGKLRWILAAPSPLINTSQLVAGCPEGLESEGLRNHLSTFAESMSKEKSFRMEHQARSLKDRIARMKLASNQLEPLTMALPKAQEEAYGLFRAMQELVGR